MTVAGVKTARTTGRSGRSGGRSSRPVVVARVTLAAPPPPAIIPIEDGPAAQLAVPASRRDLHVAGRLRRRDAMLGLGALAATLGATVAVLDMLH